MTGVNRFIEFKCVFLLSKYTEFWQFPEALKFLANIAVFYFTSFFPLGVPVRAVTSAVTALAAVVFAAPAVLVEIGDCKHMPVVKTADTSVLLGWWYRHIGKAASSF